MVTDADRPGRLTLVEGAGGLLVQIGDDATTLRDLAIDLAAPVLVVARAGLGTLNHVALTLEALASQRVLCAGVVIGAWPQDAGVIETGNREVLSGMAPLRAVLPDGAGALEPPRFETISSAAFDTEWIRDLVG